MSDHVVLLPQNVIVDRLRALQSDLSNDNRHTDALLIDIAIQTIQESPKLQRQIWEIEGRITRSVKESVLQTVAAASRRRWF